MSESRLDEFRARRQRGQDALMAHAGRTTKRFISLDSQAYRPGALDAKTKELMGLVASTVLRCDDCIAYHVIRAHEEGVTGDELEETLSIAAVVGGTITIPHLRRAYELWTELEGASEESP